MLKSTIAAAAALLLAGVAAAQAPAEVLFRNVRVFGPGSGLLSVPSTAVVFPVPHARALPVEAHSRQ